MYEQDGEVAYIFDMANSEAFFKADILRAAGKDENGEAIQPLTPSGTHIRAIPEEWTTTFGKTEYVQALINQESKIMALCPCEEEQRDSFLWCNTSKGKRKPKQITCKLFFAQLFTLMNWNPDYRYKLLGKLIHANGKYLLAFDLTATEVYMKTTTPEGKPKTSRTPVFPAEWQERLR